MDMDIKFLPSSGSSDLAWVRVVIGVNGKQYEIDFQRETGCKLGMDLLVEKMTHRFAEYIEELRRNEYEAGYKDGRSKHKRRNWFATYLSWRQRGL